MMKAYIQVVFLYMAYTSEVLIYFIKEQPVIRNITKKLANKT